MKTQAEKAADFATLHAAPGAFVAPNPWDPGSARILPGLGFKALTTTSSGYARSIGVTDHKAGRDSVLAHIRAMAAVVDLPISADLENGFGRDPATVAETIRLGAASGLVGGSIEDATGDADDPIFDIAHAADRIRAASEAARQLPFRFMVTGRTDNYLHGRSDLGDTIRRLQAYQEASAPGITDVVQGARCELSRYPPAARENPVDNIAVPWWIRVEASVVIAALSLVVALVTYPDIFPAMPLFALAILWMLGTSRSRRTFRDARHRSRAAADEREYRRSKS